jgi:hypothetical protein
MKTSVAAGVGSADESRIGWGGRFAAKTFEHDHDHRVACDNAECQRSGYRHDECGGSEDGPHSYLPVSLM